MVESDRVQQLYFTNGRFRLWFGFGCVFVIFGLLLLAFQQSQGVVAVVIGVGLVGFTSLFVPFSYRFSDAIVIKYLLRTRAMHWAEAVSIGLSDPDGVQVGFDPTKPYYRNQAAGLVAGSIITQIANIPSIEIRARIDLQSGAHVEIRLAPDDAHHLVEIWHARSGG